MREFVTLSFKLSVEPIIVTGIGHQLVKLLNEQLQIGVKANHLIVNDRYVKSIKILIHKTNMQNYTRKIARYFEMQNNVRIIV